jgi:hypothetical protein
MSPSPKRQVTIDLEAFHEDGLQQLAGLIPHESLQGLLKVVISRGLVEMLRSEFERQQPSADEISQNMMTARQRMQELRFKDSEPESKLRSKDAVPASKLRSSAQRTAPRKSAPAPFGMKQSLDELHVREAERDREMARMRRDLGLAETPDHEEAPTRPVESYIGVPLPEGLRQGLESALNAHPDLEEETLYTALLELGLKGVLADPKALRSSRDAQKAALALDAKNATRQQLRAEWRLLCQSVARGWR